MQSEDAHTPCHLEFAILLQSAPQEAGCNLALDFATAAVKSGHRVPKIFFYKRGVMVANRHSKCPSDENDPQLAWQEFSKISGSELLVCVSAGKRRGIDADSIADSFEIVGLGQFATMCLEADRLVCF